MLAQIEMWVDWTMKEPVVTDDLVQNEAMLDSFRVAYCSLVLVHVVQQIVVECRMAFVVVVDVT